MRRRAFTLIEILIVVVILGILAGMVVPQIANASDETNDSSVRTQLRILRTQVELYRVQSGGLDPQLIANQWDDLVMNNYIQRAPVNPLNQSSVVAGAAVVGAGWIWSPGPSGMNELEATDSSFALFVE